MNDNHSGPAIDPSDMVDNQAKMFGVHTYNVQSDQAAAEGGVSVTMAQMAVDASVNQAFVKSAPNLAFDLPFHIQRLFGGRVPEEGH